MLLGDVRYWEARVCYSRALFEHRAKSIFLKYSNHVIYCHIISLGDRYLVGTMQKYLQHCCPMAQRADDIDSSQSNDHCRCFCGNYYRLGFVLNFGTLKYLKSAD